MRVAGTTVPLSTNNGHTTIVDRFLFDRARTWWLILSFSLVCTQNGFLTEQISPGRLLAESRPAAPVTGGVHLLLTVITWSPIFALMAKYIRPIVGMMLSQRAVLAFPALALLSALWSSTPETTIRLALLLFLACAFGWFLAVAYAPTDQMRLFLAAGVILGLASIPIAILFPGVGLDFQGQWKGVFAQKNTLGTSMLFLFSVLAFRRVPNRRRLVVLVLQALLPIGLMMMADSKEALVCVLILLGARFAGPFLASRRREQFPFIIFATLFAITAAALGKQGLLTLLGRDATLSGRTKEWTVLIHYAAEHFWLGYGYAAFWNGSDSVRAMHLIGGSIHGADSGYLDTLLQLGVAGLLLWAILFLVSLRNITKAFLTPSLPLVGYWYSGLIIVIFALSFVWGGAFAPGGVAALVLALSCAGLSNIGGIRIEERSGTTNGSSVSGGAAA